MLGLVVDFVRQAVTRYRGKVPLWHLVHRPGLPDFLGLSEEEQIRLAARASQVARQADPAAQFTVGVERPWAEWMGNSSFQLGPLHLADYLVRADLGLAGVALEIAAGVLGPRQPPARPVRLLAVARPVRPAQPPAARLARVPVGRRPTPRPTRPCRSRPISGPPRPTRRQAAWAARWMALAVAKPFVRSVTWARRATPTPTSTRTAAFSGPTAPPSRSSTG